MTSIQRLLFIAFVIPPNLLIVGIGCGFIIDRVTVVFGH